MLELHLLLHEVVGMISTAAVTTHCIEEQRVPGIF